MKIVANTSLPAVNRPNADHWNAARSCQQFFWSSIFLIKTFLLISKSLIDEERLDNFLVRIFLFKNLFVQNHYWFNDIQKKRF